MVVKALLSFALDPHGEEFGGKGRGDKKKMESKEMTGSPLTVLSPSLSGLRVHILPARPLGGCILPTSSESLTHQTDIKGVPTEEADARVPASSLTPAPSS